MREPKIDLVAKLLVQQRDRRHFLRSAVGVLFGVGVVKVITPKDAHAQSNCSFGNELCPATSGGYECIDINKDTYNCGGCGNECIGGSRCDYGQCTCSFGEIACAGRDGRAECTDTSNDPDNCGDCGVVCPDGSNCRYGRCECGFGNANCPDSTRCRNGNCDCPIWETLCPAESILNDFDFECVNTADDAENCGECGIVCPASSTCLGGRCTCRPGMSMCPGDRGESQCFDTDNDVDHCGNCWTRCPVDGKCEDGICVSRDSDSVPDFESTPFGVGDVTNSELTAEQFGTFLPKKFPGHELITNLDRGSWEAVMYPGLNDSTMYLYMDPGDPNAQYAVAVGNVSVLPLTTDMRGFLTDLEFACNPSSGCEVLQQNIIRPGRVTYVFLSHRFNDQPDPYYSLIWGETRGSLVYTLEAFTQTNFENLANGFVNNALAAMEQ